MQANDIIAPNSIEAEESVLGSLLIDPDAINLVSGIIAAEDFFLVKNGWIFAAIKALSDRGDAIDHVTVAEELQRRSQLDQIGGKSALVFLTGRIPTSDHADTYARLVANTAVRRKALDAVSQIANLFINGNETLTDLVQQAHDILTASTAIRQNNNWKFISEFASSVYDKVEARYNKQGEALGIPTGLTALDGALVGQGWGAGEVIFIAARPGMGKSALAMGSAVHAAKLGQHVAVMSKEMTGEELTFRAVSGESSINAEKMKLGNLSDGEWSRFVESVGRTSSLSLVMDDGVDLNIEQLVTNTYRLHREWGLDILFVDYIQLLDAGVKRSQNRNNEVDLIGRKLKELAMTLRIPVVVLSQLSRKCEERNDKRPIMSDLRDSGTLEQVADTIIFIYRDDFYNTSSVAAGKAELHIAKQRHGRAGDRPEVGWIASLTKFVDIKGNINLEGF